MTATPICAYGCGGGDRFETLVKTGEAVELSLEGDGELSADRGDAAQAQSSTSLAGNHTPGTRRG